MLLLAWVTERAGLQGGGRVLTQDRLHLWLHGSPGDPDAGGHGGGSPGTPGICSQVVILSYSIEIVIV